MPCSELKLTNIVVRDAGLVQTHVSWMCVRLTTVNASDAVIAARYANTMQSCIKEKIQKLKSKIIIILSILAKG